jgi:hypothetical protein
MLQKQHGFISIHAGQGARLNYKQPQVGLAARSDANQPFAGPRRFGVQFTDARREALPTR